MDTEDSDAAVLNEHWGQYNPTFPIVTGCASVFADWGTGNIPHTTILDRNGIVLGNYVGYSADVLTTMIAVIEENLIPPTFAVSELSITSDDNGDGIANPGESVAVDIALENVSTADYDQITATLWSSDPDISITAAVALYPALNPGETGTNLTPFTMDISADCPDIAVAELQLDVYFEDSLQTIPVPFQVGERSLFTTVDMEGDLSGWTHEAGTTGWEDQWHVSQEDAFSPEHSWKCGSTTGDDYASHQDARLMSPMFTIPPFGQLRINHRMNGEVSGTYPDSAYDGGFVEASLDGVDWQQLQTTAGHYNATFRWESGGGNPASHPYAGGTPCFSGDFDWQESRFDLSDFSGESVYFRFNFGADNGGTAEGWYIDDLQIYGLDNGEGINADCTVPVSHTLVGNYPNPFNPSTQIRFNLAGATVAELQIFNLAGERVAVLGGSQMAPGSHELTLDGSHLASGIYFVSLIADHRVVDQNKIMLLK